MWYTSWLPWIPRDTKNAKRTDSLQGHYGPFLLILFHPPDFQVGGASSSPLIQSTSNKSQTLRNPPVLVRECSIAARIPVLSSGEKPACNLHPGFLGDPFGNIVERAFSARSSRNPRAARSDLRTPGEFSWAPLVSFLVI